MRTLSLMGALSLNTYGTRPSQFSTVWGGDQDSRGQGWEGGSTCSRRVCYFRSSYRKIWFRCKLNIWSKGMKSFPWTCGAWVSALYHRKTASDISSCLTSLPSHTSDSSNRGKLYTQNHGKFSSHSANNGHMFPIRDSVKVQTNVLQGKSHRLRSARSCIWGSNRFHKLDIFECIFSPADRSRTSSGLYCFYRWRVCEVLCPRLQGV